MELLFGTIRTTTKVHLRTRSTCCRARCAWYFAATSNRSKSMLNENLLLSRSGILTGSSLYSLSRRLMPRAGSGKLTSGRPFSTISSTAASVAALDEGMADVSSLCRLSLRESAATPLSCAAPMSSISRKTVDTRERSALVT